MPAKKKNKPRITVAKKTVVVIKTTIPAKDAGDTKLAKANYMLSKTKWLD
jgi:hypothetical protein